MYQKLLVMIYGIENNRILESIKKGFLMLMPVLMLGAMALVLKSLPIQAVQQWMSEGIGLYVNQLLDSIHGITYGYLSIYVAMSISYNYAKHFNQHNSYLHVLSMVLSIICVVACLGYGAKGFDTESFGATGVFTAIVISIVSTWLFYFLYRKMFWETYHTRERMEEVDYRHLSHLMIPFVICVLLFFAFNRVLNLAFHVTSLNGLFADFFGMAFQHTGNSITAGILLVFTESILWFFGVHGGNALEQVQQNLFVPTNLDPNVIVSKTFVDTFSLMGGCGTAICLFLALLFFSRQPKNREIMKTSAFPIIFNVNEPLVFGLPIVYNPILFLPFLIVPIVSLLIAYIATILGIIPVTTALVEWTTPVILSGYAATGSVWGAVVQAVIIVVGTLIYAPFIRLLEVAHTKGEQVFAKEMQQQYMESMAKGTKIHFLNQHNSVAVACEALLTRMRKDMQSGEIPMYYQPQMDQEENVYGAEALLRWTYGNQQMFPPLVFHLAREEGIEDDLTYAIIEQVCRDIVKMNERVTKPLQISANISALQMNDTQFVQRVIAIADKYQIVNQLSLEVTEDVSLEHMSYISENINQLNHRGIEVSIDDFSMGNTSLKYLQQNHFSYVKLDGQIVKNMMNNDRSQEIIASIINLGKSLDFKVVAEYVDTQGKRDVLLEMGCDYLQGYLYSPAIPLQELVAFVMQHQN